MLRNKKYLGICTGCGVQKRTFYGFTVAMFDVSVGILEQLHFQIWLLSAKSEANEMLWINNSGYFVHTYGTCILRSRAQSDVQTE